MALLLLGAGIAQDPRPRGAASPPGDVARQIADEYRYAGKTIEGWAAMLAAPEALRRVAASRALGEIGPRAVPAVPALAAALADRDEFVRSSAAGALGEIGPGAIAALPRMIAALKEASYFHRGLIASSIAELGPGAVPPLADLIAERDDDLQWQAIHALGRVGPGAIAAVPRLKSALGSEDGKIREVAASALWRISKDRDAITALAGCLGDKYEFVRMSAAEDLAGAGVLAAPALPGLVRALEDGDEAVRNRSAEAIGRIGPAAKGAVPALLRSVGSRHPGFGSYASKAIAGIGSAAIPALIEALGDPSEEVCGVAADSLGQVGRDAGPVAVPPLAAMAHRGTLMDRIAAATAIWRISKDAAVVPILERAAIDGEILTLEKGDFRARGFALDALAEIGPAAAPAVPTLIGIFERDDKLFRGDVAEVLGRIGPSAIAAVPTLEATLTDRDERADRGRVAAALALWRIARGRSGLESLVRDLRTGGASGRRSAIAAIGEVGPMGRPAMPILADLLRTSPDDVDAIAKALVKMGAASAPALPALVEAFNDEFATNRRELAAAIRSIRTASSLPEAPAPGSR